MPQPRQTSSLDQVSALVFGRPWAILPSDMDIVTSVVAMYLSGEKPTAQEARAAAETRTYGALRTGEQGSDAQTVRIVPLHGTINNRADAFDLMSGGTSPQAFARTIRAAADDPNVAEIIIDVDSGGGTVAGTRTMFEAVQYATGKKNVTAVANGTMASAAYWAVAPARIVATATGIVGSIGILAAWRDVSRAHDQAGVTTHYYRSGDQKALGGPGEAHSDQIDATLKADVAAMFDVFLADVAAGRGVTAAQARERWGSGRTWIGQAAVDAGLADTLGTLQAEIDRAVSGQRPAARSRASPPTTAHHTDHLIAALNAPPAPAAAAALADLGITPPTPPTTPPEAPPMKIRLQAADGTFHEFEPTDLTGIQAFLNTQMQARATSTILAAYTALGVALPEGVTQPTALDTDKLTAIKAQAADGAAYRTTLLDQIGALTIATQGNDEAGQQAAERQKRVWATADMTDLKAEVTRLEGVRDGLFPAGPVSKAMDKKTPVGPARAYYGRR